MNMNKVTIVEQTSAYAVMYQGYVQGTFPNLDLAKAYKKSLDNALKFLDALITYED